VPAPAPAPWVRELRPGVFAYVQPDGSWWLNNCGFVAGGGMVVSIDTCATERRTAAYLEAVRTHAGRTPQLVVSTHHHGDHTNGNCLLPGATIIGHRRCRQEMLRSGIVPPEGLFEPVEWGELSPAPPFVTFEDRVEIHVGDVAMELLHVGIAAHTTNDVVAWLPEQRVLFTGDLAFNGGTPFFLMGSPAGMLVALDRLVELEPEVVVPGHGDPTGAEVFDTVGEYVRFVQDLAERSHARGLSPLEAARGAALGPFAALSDPERLAGNLHRAYAELDGARPGDDIDLVAAFSDMVALHGGPLRCLA
jgi:cyclase